MCIGKKFFGREQNIFLYYTTLSYSLTLAIPKHTQSEWIKFMLCCYNVIISHGFRFSLSLIPIIPISPSSHSTLTWVAFFSLSPSLLYLSLFSFIFLPLTLPPILSPLLPLLLLLDIQCGWQSWSENRKCWWGLFAIRNINLNFKWPLFLLADS